MLSENFDVVSLSILFSGIVFAIVELGLLIFILKVKRKSRQLFWTLIITSLWAVFLLSHYILSNFYASSFIIISDLLMIFVMALFVIISPMLLKSYNKSLVLFTFTIFFITVLFHLGAEYFAPSLDNLAEQFLIAPLLCIYFLCIESTIRSDEK